MKRYLWGSAMAILALASGTALACGDSLRAQWALWSVPRSGGLACAVPYEAFSESGDPAIEVLLEALEDARPARCRGASLMQVRDYSLAALFGLTGGDPDSAPRLSALPSDRRRDVVGAWKAWWEANRGRPAPERAASPARDETPNLQTTMAALDRPWR